MNNNNSHDEIFQMAKESPFVKEFEERNPVLKILKDRDYAYLDFGELRFYFHGAVKTKEVETMRNGLQIQTEIPFDGIEISFNKTQ